MDIIRRRSLLSFKPTRTTQVLVLFLVFFLFSTQNYFILSLGIICKPSERRALLSFKQNLKNSSYGLSSWSSENCCRWAGVVCSNTTDHVVQLQLHDLGLGGDLLNPSLQELKQLRHLDLSFNHFDGIRIPDFLGSLQSLRYLNLSSSNFSGMVPHQLGNLSNLCYLDLSSNYFYEKGLTVVGNFQWISHISSLEHLDLSFVSLGNASSNWFHVVNMLPSLLVLRLSHCDLSSDVDLPTSLSHVNFTSLQVLDLSFNSLTSTLLPEWLYSLTNLQQLDLSENYLLGTISPSIGNLTKLTLLNLKWNSGFQGTIPASVGNLTKLTLLDLSRNELIEGEIPTSIGNLCNLQILDLSDNKLTGEISGFLESSTRCIITSSSLQRLDLSRNHLSGPLPDEQLGRLQNLERLSLGSNSFSGSIPISIGKLTLLTYLDLRENELNGSIPKSLGNLSKLETLFLHDNSLEGNVSEGLSKLETLYLSYNYGLEVSEAAFSTLLSLREIGLDSVVLKVSPEWIPPFQLSYANLRNCGLGPRFPNWLRTQQLLYYLDLSSNGISGTVPTWLWNLSSPFYYDYLNLSHNHFIGELPKVLLNASSSYDTFIYLNSNRFKGPLPRLDSGVGELDLSNNSFSGPISALVCNPLTTGVNDLRVLDLSNNLLSGDLSQCWLSWTSLNLLRLENNNITGKIPSSMGFLRELLSLHLRNNTLSGELPLSLRNCTLLMNVDIGENMLTGRLPIWLGESFTNLLILRLRRNKFHGEISQELCDLTSLQILDLAHNNLSGSIPRCFKNLRAMATKQKSSRKISYSSLIGEGYIETTSLVTKGREFEYSNTLTLVTSMDLSNNSFSGEIPEELTSLIGLISLNLSENHFTGKIPEKIGDMVLLESLDFSNNNISGVIPQSISGLYSLSHLNLSYNNLSGKIPSSTQLQLLTEFEFIGNQDLCGPPLKKCNPAQQPGDIGDRADEDEDWFEMKWFYMSMGVGFVLGFWVFCGVMVLKRSWRIAYFRFLDDTKDKLCLLF